MPDCVVRREVEGAKASEALKPSTEVHLPFIRQSARAEEALIELREASIGTAYVSIFSLSLVFMHLIGCKRITER